MDYAEELLDMGVDPYRVFMHPDKEALYNTVIQECSESNDANRQSTYRADYMDYEPGVGDVLFHRLDGKEVRLNKVLFDTISPVATNDWDLSGDKENGDPFHVPFVAWWEVVYDY